MDNRHYVRLSHAKLVKSLDASEKQIKEFENESEKPNERKEILGEIEFYSSNNGIASYQHGICFCVCLFFHGTL